MAFTDDLSNEELLAVAEFFAVDLPEELPKTDAAKKRALVKALTEGDEPVTDEDYTNTYLPQKPKTEEELAEEAAKAENREAEKVRGTLVKMYGRASLTFNGVRITRDHPFGLFSEEEAEYLVENYEGLSYATPKEAADYYA